LTIQLLFNASRQTLPPGPLLLLARVLEQTKDYAGAQKILRQLISRSPNFVYWLEWSRVQLVRYYWALLLFAGALYFYSRYRKARGHSDGRGSG
jgi:hypothetical protein